jgi:mono/diheme cytochrome c family protein
VRSVVSACAGLYRLALVRRVAPIAILLVLLAFAGAGCSKPGGKITAPLPTKVVGTVPKAAPVSTVVPPQYKNGDPVAGKAVFTSAGCVGCHTLAAANSHGTVGPNLDDVKPPLSLAVARVTQGKNAMPSFKAQLTAKQIADVTAFVVKSSGGNPNG